MKAESEKILIELLDNDITETRRTALLHKLDEDEEALETYRLIINSEDFIGQLPLENPSVAFNEKLLLGYRRIKTREYNNRLLTYLVGAAMAIIVVVFSFGGDIATPLPVAAPVLEEISSRIPGWQLSLDADRLKQLALVLVAGLLLLLLDKIMHKRKIQGTHSLS